MNQTLPQTAPITTVSGTVPALSAHLRRYDDDVFNNETGQGPFAKDPIVSDPEMLVPPTAALYDPSSASLSDVVGKAFAPYYDTFQRTMRGLFHREPPRIYTTLPTAEEIKEYSYVAPPTPLTWQHYAAAGLVTTALTAGCSTGSGLADTIVKAVTLNLAGGLATFLYGMKLMSDGVKASSGDTLRNIIGRFTGNRFSALAVGTGVTSVIQSSSITSVLTLGLVSAGVMTLTQALGVIAGANIGTTMTAWLMSSHLSKYGLAMIGGAGLTYLFSPNKPRTREIAKGILGLGMVFHGLEIMSAGFKSPEIITPLTHLFSSLNDPSVGGLALCMLAGAGVTATIQSSSATVGICIALASKGIIPFEAAAGIALGANIGTTITAWLATPGSTRDAKRAALFHTGFNVGGALLVLPWAPQFAAMAKNLAINLGITSPEKQIAFIHTLFNVGAAGLFLPFLGPIKNGIVRLLPDRTADQEKEPGYGINRLSGMLLDTPALALGVSKAVLEEARQVTEKALGEFLSVVTSKSSPRDLEQPIREAELALDAYRRNLLTYFNRVEQSGMSRGASKELDTQRRMCLQLENIGDHLLKLLLTFKEQRPDDLPHAAQAFLIERYQEIMEHFLLVSNMMTEGRHAASMPRVVAENDRLKALIDEQRERVLQEVSSAAQIFYHDALGLYRDILGNTKNIAQAISGTK